MNKLLIPILLFAAVLFTSANISAQSADDTHIIYSSNMENAISSNR